jgi:hypothetical protein
MADKTPPTGGARKPNKKKTFSLDDFKKKKGAEDVADKELTWLKCSPAFQEATGLPGFPVGYVALSRGFSNTGKSTSVCEAAVAAQKAGMLPIIIDTENNIGRQRLELMGFDWGANVISIDNEYLLENYGKVKDKNRTEASIEDMADCINDYLNLQEAGELPMDLVFIIDSLGTLDCIRSINAHDKGTSDNNMWNAGAFERAFKSIINYRIPNSRKVNKEFTNTIIGVQKIWLDSMQGAGVVKHKGGEAFFYGSRLIFHHGGIQSHGTKKITATSKKRDVAFGIETKISVVKNQIDGPLGGINLEGRLISTPHGFIASDNDAKNQYKKDNIQYFRDVLGGDIDINEIQTKYSETDMDEGDFLDQFQG